MMDRSHEFHEFALKMFSKMRPEQSNNIRPATSDGELAYLRMTLFRQMYEDWEGIR